MTLQELPHESHTNLGTVKLLIVTGREYSGSKNEEKDVKASLAGVKLM